jgi:replicative DNA helicase
MIMNLQEIELKLILSLDSFQKLIDIKDAGITSKSFTHYSKEFGWIERYSRKYPGRVPDYDVMHQKFPELDVEQEQIDWDQSKEWFFGQVKKAELTRSMTRVLEESIRILVSEEKPVESLDYTVQSLIAMRPGNRVAQSKTDKDAIKRLDDYLKKLELRRQGKSLGIPSGIPFLDQNNVSWLPGQLIGILGSTKDGKSLLAEYLACVAYQQKNKVIFFSPELSIPEVEYRWDSIMSKMYGYDFSNIGLNSGENIDVEKYREWLEKISEREDWITVTSDIAKKQLSLDTIETYVDKYNPSLIVVDGIYLIKGRGKNNADSWERVGEIAEGLKSLAVSRNIVVIASNQLNREARMKDNPDIENTGFSYMFPQLVDKCIIINRPRDIQSDKVRSIKLSAVRSGVDLPPVNIIWDVDTGNIGRSI